MQNFSDFNLKKQILDAIASIGYEVPTPIQQKAITPILEGRDIIGNAQTGTGKTAAFSLPILNEIERKKFTQVLILTPTRELAIQIRENIRDYSKYLRLKTVVIYGGVKQGSQVRALEQGADIIIATPGRLLDLVSQKYIDLSNITHFVLDEADTMLDMGFIHDINNIIKLIPKKRQTLLFSATMPAKIKELAQKLLKNPLEIKVAPVSSPIDTVAQTLYYVNKSNKDKLLLDIMEDKKFQSTLIFTRTKHGADKVAKILKANKFKVAAIHGNKSQSNRQRTLQDFKDGKTNTLVATDIAARGIDIEDLSYVINYEIPNVPETYVHRIGRSGRAGRSGNAIALCNVDEKPFIKEIQKLMNSTIEVVAKHNYPMVNEPGSNNSDKNKKGKKKSSNSGNRNGYSNNSKSNSTTKKSSSKKSNATSKANQKNAKSAKSSSSKKDNSNNPRKANKDNNSQKNNEYNKKNSKDQKVKASKRKSRNY